jgi:acyl CoA:acetate/3-ketoacid CoA transferase
MHNKITSAAEAVAIVQSGDAICTSGFVAVMLGFCDHYAIDQNARDQHLPRIERTGSRNPMSYPICTGTSLG